MILLVDDQPELRHTIARVLKRHSYEVVEAADAREAIAWLRKSRFDLVLTDVQMPQTSGLVLAAYIHASWPETRVILMSGYMSTRTGELVAEGWAEFIHKPIESSLLIATIQRLLGVEKSRTRISLRRKVGTQTWHACTTCKDWPSSDYEELPPTFFLDQPELCNECRLSLSQGKYF